MGFPVRPDGTIDQASWERAYGADTWPFTVSSGQLAALGPGVFFVVDGVPHPLNGASEPLLRAIPGGGRELELIRRRDPAGLFRSTLSVITCALALRDHLPRP